MRRSPHISLGYGAAFAVISAALALGFWNVNAQPLFLPLAGGFLLIGPAVALGLYETSRRLERGESVRFVDVAGTCFEAGGQVGLFGAMLIFIFGIWALLAVLLLMVFLQTDAMPQPDDIMRVLLFTSRGLSLLIVGTIVGGVLAAFVFAVSVVAVPMLLVTDIDPVSAARASVAAVVLNPQPMALWAVLIAAIIALGFATLLIGLVIAFPLIGHASWHAFTDLYGEWDNPRSKPENVVARP